GPGPARARALAGGRGADSTFTVTSTSQSRCSQAVSTAPLRSAASAATSQDEPWAAARASAPARAARSAAVAARDWASTPVPSSVRPATTAVALPVQASIEAAPVLMAPARRPAPDRPPGAVRAVRSEEHTSELQSRFDLVCRLLLEKKKHKREINILQIYHIRIQKSEEIDSEIQ